MAVKRYKRTLKDGSILAITIDGSGVKITINDVELLPEDTTTPPPDPIPTDLVEVTALSKITKAGRYKLKRGTHSVNESLVVPNDTYIDATGCVINYTGVDWSGVYDLSDRKNITVIGGTYSTKRNNFIANMTRSRNVIMKDHTLQAGSGWAYRVGSGDGITLDGLVATIWYAYLVFADGPSVEEYAKNVLIKNWKVDGGSENESCIRVCGVNGLIIRDSHLFCDLNPVGARKNIAMRLHEGSDYLIENVELRGNFGIGPMGGGDGGQQWGFTQFIGANGQWYVSKEQADMSKTLAHRAKSLALRTKKVRIKNVTIVDGQCQANPGLIDATWDGGSITNSRQPEKPGWTSPSVAFYGINSSYPSGKDIYNNKLETDIVREAPQLTVTNVNFQVARIDDSGIIKIGSGCKLNGKPV